MDITLYSFTKRKKSTKKPSGGVTYTGTLKQNTSVVKPSIIFEFESFPAVNYAYIPDFARYYWITDKVQISNNVWELVMSVDVLASYKSEIGNSEKYVLRSASSKNGYLTDMKYPTTTEVLFRKTSIQPFDRYIIGLQDLGTFVVGVVESGTGFGGAITYYALNLVQFSRLRSALMSGGSAGYFGEIVDPDIKNFAIVMGNPLQYIKYCRYFPFTNISGQIQTMKLGNVEIADMPLLSSPVIIPSDEILNLSDHPEYEARGFYMNYEPFTDRYLYWSPLGIVKLSGLLYRGRSELVVKNALDLTSGTGLLTVETSNSAIPTIVNSPIYESSYVIGYDVPIAQMITGDPLKIISTIGNALSAGANIISGNIAGAFSAGASAVIDFHKATTPQLTGFINGSGSRIVPSRCYLIEAFNGVADSNNAEFGSPLMRTVPINTLSGYVLCADGEIECDGTESEITEIESYLTGGFFYE